MEEKFKNVLARMAQIEIELNNLHNMENSFIVELYDNEKELLAQQIVLQREQMNLQDQKIKTIQKYNEDRLQLINEYRKLENFLSNNRDEIPLEAIKVQFSDIKELLANSKLKEYSSEILAQSENKKECFTRCTECYTNACIQCTKCVTKCVMGCIECVKCATVCVSKVSPVTIPQCTVTAYTNACNTSGNVYNGE